MEYDTAAQAYIAFKQAQGRVIKETSDEKVEPVIIDLAEVVITEATKETQKKTLGQLLEEINLKDTLTPGNYTDSEGIDHTNKENKFVVVDGKDVPLTEDFPTIASFLEGNPLAADAVKATMDLVWRGEHAAARAFLDKNHQDIADQVMALVHLQPHIAQEIATTKNSVESENNS